MNTPIIYTQLLIFLLCISPIILITLLFVTAPYGRHSQSGWGIKMDNRMAWIIMELPAVLAILGVYLYYRNAIHPASVIFIIIWQWHYIYRTFYFPFRLKKTNRSFPVLLVLFAIIFNIINGYLNGVFLFHIRPITNMAYFSQWHFILGLILFSTGFFIHYKSDKTIIDLRKNSDVQYSIPRGGLFSYITNPNYFGEFLQWTGWAILTWSVAGAAFALFTFCNLFPRAISNHKWYRATFENYPKERKVFFPFLY